MRIIGASGAVVALVFEVESGRERHGFRSLQTGYV